MVQVIRKGNNIMPLYGTDPFTDDVHVLPKHFAELDRSKPLVASIYITPDAKLMPN